MTDSDKAAEAYLSKMIAAGIDPIDAAAIAANTTYTVRPASAPGVHDENAVQRPGFHKFRDVSAVLTENVQLVQSRPSKYPDQCKDLRRGKASDRGPKGSSMPAKKRTPAAEAIAAKVSELKQVAILEFTEAEMERLQLSLFDVAPWDNDQRAIPNDYARSALFTVRNKKVKRAAYEDKEIFHINKDVSIRYTGIELRADDDELVWQQVLEYAKKEAVGLSVRFSFYQLCKDLGWSINGRYYKRAEQCLTRLQATAVQVSSERLGKLKSMSLIKEFNILERSTNKAFCEVELSPHLVHLFAGDHYSKFQWDRYRKLTPITRRLFDYLVSHKRPYPLKLETFKLMCGSDTATAKKWREQSADACKELTESGLVAKAWVAGTQLLCER